MNGRKRSGSSLMKAAASARQYQIRAGHTPHSASARRGRVASGTRRWTCARASSSLTKGRKKRSIAIKVYPTRSSRCLLSRIFALDRVSTVQTEHRHWDRRVVGRGRDARGYRWAWLMRCSNDQVYVYRWADIAVEAVAVAAPPRGLGAFGAEGRVPRRWPCGLIPRRDGRELELRSSAGCPRARGVAVSVTVTSQLHFVKRKGRMRARDIGRRADPVGRRTRHRRRGHRARMVTETLLEERQP